MGIWQTTGWFLLILLPSALGNIPIEAGLPVSSAVPPVGLYVETLSRHDPILRPGVEEWA